MGALDRLGGRFRRRAGHVEADDARSVGRALDRRGGPDAGAGADHRDGSPVEPEQAHGLLPCGFADRRQPAIAGLSETPPPAA